MRVDPVVKKQTLVIAAGAAVMTAVEQAVFLLIPGGWCVEVLVSNLIMSAVMVLHFFLLGLTVQSAVMLEPDDAKKKMRFSQSMRLLMVVAVLAAAAAVVIGLKWEYKIIYAMLPPLLFNRITVFVYGLTASRRNPGADGSGSAQEQTGKEDDDDEKES